MPAIVRKILAIGAILTDGSGLKFLPPLHFNEVRRLENRREPGGREARTDVPGSGTPEAEIPRDENRRPSLSEYGADLVV